MFARLDRRDGLHSVDFKVRFPGLRPGVDRADGKVVCSNGRHGFFVGLLLSLGWGRCSINLVAMNA